MDVPPGAEQQRAPQLGGAERSGQGVLAHTHAPALAAARLGPGALRTNACVRGSAWPADIVLC